MLVFTSEKVFKGQKMKWRFTKKSFEFCLKREKMLFPVPSVVLVSNTEK